MNIQQLAADPAAFRDVVLIDVDGQTVRLCDVIDPWQAEDFAALDPGLKRAAGRGDERGPRFAWLERPRGHSKTSDESMSVLWMLFASSRRIRGVAAAADKEQAGLLRDAIGRLLDLNPWLSAAIEVQVWKVKNTHTGSELTITSSDVASSWGTLADFIIVDEVTHWRQRDLFDSLFSAADKRGSCVFIAISNAGFSDSWQWDVRETVRTDADWYFSRLEGPQATWITEDRLERQRRILPDVPFRRLWLNEWSEGSGDALKGADIDAAVIHTGPMGGMEQGWRYVAGLDLSVSRDRSALVVVGRHVGWTEEVDAAPPIRPRVIEAMIDVGALEDDFDPIDFIEHPATNKLRLADVRSWAPPKGGRIDLQVVSDAVHALHGRFGFDAVLIDPYQAELMGQQLRRAGVPIELQPFSGSALTEMASYTIEAFTSGRIELYDCPELIDDLRRLRIVEKSYGFRLDAPRTAAGHCDTATALSLALLGCRRIAPHTARRVTDGDIPFAALMDDDTHAGSADFSPGGFGSGRGFFNPSPSRF